METQRPERAAALGEAEGGAGIELASRIWTERNSGASAIEGCPLACSPSCSYRCPVPIEVSIVEVLSTMAAAS